MTADTDIQAGVAAIVEEITGTPADDVELAQDFAVDLDVDSLSMVEIVVATEERFGVLITDAQAADLRTVGDLVDLITTHVTTHVTTDRASSPS